MSDTPADDARERGADEPDPSQLWAWARRATRPYLGWILIALGVVALTVGYFGVSREVLVARQIPYFASGGLFGIGLVFLGGIALLIDDLRRSNEHLARTEAEADERLRRVETAVSELRDVLLDHPDAPAPTGGSAADTSLVALPGGSSYHLADCRVVQGKQVEAVTDPAASDLSACKLCQPDAG